MILSASLLSEIHDKLKQHLHHKISLITLSEKGVFIEDENASYIVPAHVRNIADVSGAGDTVIAVASLYMPQQKIFCLLLKWQILPAALFAKKPAQLQLIKSN